VITAIYHCNIQIIGRTRGRSAVAAAAYRSGERLTNNWYGLTHDYTKKGGVIHTEIMLPSHAPVEFADRSALWNAVEAIEKSSKAQLAREINIALPLELPREQQIELVREYCRTNFVSAGMCADFAVHDTSCGNPHAHIMLTMRPLRRDGTWDDKQRKLYRLDENGHKIYDSVKRQYDCASVPTTDWNEHTKAEEWRSSWAALTNKYLERNSIQVRIDNRSYKRQGIEQIPTIHLGSAAAQMERRGIRTQKGDINRQTAADNKMLKEIQARLSRLYDWSRKGSIDSNKDIKFDVISKILTVSPDDSRYRKIRNLKTGAEVLRFMQEHQISSVDDLHKYIKDKNSKYYSVRKDIVSIENKIKVFDERLEIWDMYERSKPIRKQFDSIKSRKCEKFIEDHRSEMILFERSTNYLDELKASGIKITPSQWRREREKLVSEKNQLYTDMGKIKDEIKSIESIRRTLDELTKDELALNSKHNTHEL